uniref:RxLR effector candidate protein n=1 Tax=Hyaloperonospora arabidopsidis (strain Emoy2) TaxID=559515 RepID=M4C3N2_HYAAE
MRIQYMALVVASALVASTTHGVQASPNSVKSSSLRSRVEARGQLDVNGRTTRFLTSYNHQATGHAASALHGKRSLRALSQAGKKKKGHHDDAETEAAEEEEEEDDDSTSESSSGSSDDSSSDSSSVSSSDS